MWLDYMPPRSPRREVIVEWDKWQLQAHDDRRDAKAAEVAARKAAKAKADLGYQTPDFLVKGYYEDRAKAAPGYQTPEWLVKGYYDCDR